MRVTSGVIANRRTWIRDQDRAPDAGESEARRKFWCVNDPDWHLLGCQNEVGGDVYVNKVGTFGVASASYYWSRAALANGRLTQYFTGRSVNTWHQLVADDFHLEASVTEYRAALISFFVLCSTAGVPVSKGKTVGGDSVAWLGFELLHSTYHLGIWERCAARCIKWAEEVTGSDTVNTTNFEEGLGRLMYVAEAPRTREAFSFAKPWVFERGEKPALVISAIEALAVLMGFKLFHGDDARGTRTDPDDPFVHIQSWQWVGPEQADVEQVPIKRGCGTCLLPQKDVNQQVRPGRAHCLE